MDNLTLDSYLNLWVHRRLNSLNVFFSKQVLTLAALQPLWSK